MIVLDATLLLDAYDSRAKEHAGAQTWIEQTLSGGELVGIPWQTAYAFLRVVTNPKVPGERLSLAEAVKIVEEWEAQPNVRFLGPGEQHWKILRRMLLEGQAHGPMVTDAQLAALVIEHGGELYSADRDFARFPGIQWRNPLED
jgi:uncharacterized protein